MMSRICDDLRTAILQAAIQGKLTKQLPEDGNAEDLLEKIKAEKEKLIADGKIKKQKPLAPIADEELPFEIPKNWRWVHVGDIFEHNTGKTKNASQNLSGELRKYITTSNLYWGYFDLEKVGEMHFKQEELEKYTVKRSDLLVCEGGDFGRAAVWDNNEEVCFQNHVHRLRPYYEVDIQFFYWLFYFYKKSGLIKGKGIGIQGLSSNALHMIIFPLPPLAEQRRIVEKVDELMGRVGGLEQSTNALAALKKAFPDDIKAALLQYAIQGKLTKQLPEDGNAEDLLEKIKAEKEKLIADGKIKKQKPLAPIADEELPFEIPKNWRWARLGELVLLNPKNILSDDAEVSFVPMALVNAGYSNSFSYEEKKWSKVKKGFTHFADGDLGVAKITPCFQNRKSVIFHNLKNGVGSGTTELSIMRPYSNEIYRPYLLWFLKTNYFIDGGVRSFTGTAGQQRIHKDYIKLCPMPLPPVAEQKRIVERLDVVFKIVESLQEKL